MRTTINSSASRHKLHSHRKPLSDQSVRTLSSEYELRSQRSTTEFIRRHPGIVSTLLVLKTRIEASFGHAKPALEAISDPEESTELLRVQILTRLAPKAAMDAMESMENDWLAETNSAMAKFLLLTVAPE